MSDLPWARIGALLSFLALASTMGACAAPGGLVPEGRELAIDAVSVTRADLVETDEGFVDSLREKLMREVSRIPPGGELTALHLEVRELGPGPTGDRMVSHGELIDVMTGESHGEFPVVVQARREAVAAGWPAVRESLIKTTAEQVMVTLFGQKRAQAYAANEPRYPFDSLGELSASADPVPLPLPADYLALPPDEAPTIIAAPELPG